MNVTLNGRKGQQASPAKRNILLRVAAAAALVYLIGFGLFLALLPEPKASDDATGDAIVALTGEGDRLAAAVTLLEMGNGARLLITGVNKTLTKPRLKALLKGGPSFDCCTDLGFAAADTRGNAEEAAIWAHDHHYTRLVIVTAAYHMPRSLLEFQALMPDVRLIPYPVTADFPGGSSWQGFKRLNGEFVKYVASWVRIGFLASPPTAA